MKKEKFFLSIILILALFFLYFFDYRESNITYEPEKSFVTNVIDGDTIVVSGGERVRFLGMDTPEKGEPYYKEAKTRVEQLIEQKEIFLVREKEDKDKYDRLLRYIFLNDTNINLLLVQEGLARCYFYEESEYKKSCGELEADAITNKIGIWNSSAP